MITRESSVGFANDHGAVRLEDAECLRYDIVNEADLAEGLAKVGPLEEMKAADLALLLSGVHRGARGGRSLDCGLRVISLGPDDPFAA